MFYSLFFSTLPLFGLVLIGFISGKFDLLNKSDSKVFLKLVGLVIAPALGIKIIGNFWYEFINWRAAAPIGAMGLVFASIYNVTTDAVVRSGIISYILALLSIPFVGNITP